MDEKNFETQVFEKQNSESEKYKKILQLVYVALNEKGYNPIDQIIGYILSGDPTYITSYNNARSIIQEVERDELLGELLKSYLKWENDNEMDLSISFTYCIVYKKYVLRIRLWLILKESWG